MVSRTLTILSLQSSYSYGWIDQITDKLDLRITEPLGLHMFHPGAICLAGQWVQPWLLAASAHFYSWWTILIWLTRLSIWKIQASAINSYSYSMLIVHYNIRKKYLTLQIKCFECYSWNLRSKIPSHWSKKQEAKPICSEAPLSPSKI